MSTEASTEQSGRRRPFDLEAAVCNIVRHVEGANVAQREHGAEWYPGARLECERLARAAGMGTERAAAIIALLSPRLAWRANMAAATAIIGGGRTTLGLGAQRAKAYRMMAGGKVTWQRMGRQRVKVWSFFRAIMGDPDAVTLDVWAVRALGVPISSGWLDSEGTYDMMAEAYREAARRLGIGAAECQAITWVVVRGAAD